MGCKVRVPTEPKRERIRSITLKRTIRMAQERIRTTLRSFELCDPNEVVFYQPILAKRVPQESHLPRSPYSRSKTIDSRSLRDFRENTRTTNRTKRKVRMLQFHQAHVQEVLTIAHDCEYIDSLLRRRRNTIERSIFFRRIGERRRLFQTEPNLRINHKNA